MLNLNNLRGMRGSTPPIDEESLDSLTSPTGDPPETGGEDFIF
jgi:hypothetical protein